MATTEKQKDEINYDNQINPSSKLWSQSEKMLSDSEYLNLREIVDVHHREEAWLSLAIKRNISDGIPENSSASEAVTEVEDS